MTRLNVPRGIVRVALLLVLFAPAVAVQHIAHGAEPRRVSLPERLSDADFWKLQADISEPGGYFQIEDNYTSNEPEVGQLFTELRDQRVDGDVYVGVGPEQNFTYIAAIRPKMAFIVDIRRQAAVHHLMYKAMFELAADRAEFISILFGLPRPSGLDSLSPIQSIWIAYNAVGRDSTLSAKNYARIVERLTRTHGFTLTTDESEKLRAVFNAFQAFGPNIGTRGIGGGARGGTFQTLTGNSYDAKGEIRSFLSSEENYRYIKSLHEKNLIVPLTGDFGGPKALKALGAYLKEKGGKVRAFYVSNVEQYLFRDDKAHTYYQNVGALPLDSASVFIRPYSMRRGFSGGGNRPLCPIATFLNLDASGRITNYNDALACAGPQ